MIPLRAQPVAVPGTFSALQHRNFRLYIAGQLVSLAGTWMQVIAQGWLVYEISHSEWTLGIVGFAAAIPALLVSPWGGVVVDRVPKRNLLVITQSAAMLLAFILSALVFTHTVQVWHVVVLAGFLGLSNSFDGPARQSFVIDMVGRGDMPNAIALNSMTFNSARVIGPALGGLMLASIGAGWCFLLNGLSFLAVITGLLLMRLPTRESKPLGGSPWQQLLGGLRYVRERRELAALLLLALIFSLFGITYWTVLPAFVDKMLHRQAVDFGVIQAASGLGAVTGTLIIARYAERSGMRGRWLGWANLAYPSVLILFSLTGDYTLSLGLAVVLGAGFMIQFTLINILLQTRLDDAMRGRVMSLYTLTFFGFSPFGNLAIGWAAETWGLSLAISLCAVLAAALSMLVALNVPEVRRLA